MAPSGGDPGAGIESLRAGDRRRARGGSERRARRRARRHARARWRSSRRDGGVAASAVLHAARRSALRSSARRVGGGGGARGDGRRCWRARLPVRTPRARGGDDDAEEEDPRSSRRRRARERARGTPSSRAVRAALAETARLRSPRRRRMIRPRAPPPQPAPATATRRGAGIRNRRDATRVSRRAPGQTAGGVRARRRGRHRSPTGAVSIATADAVVAPRRARSPGGAALRPPARDAEFSTGDAGTNLAARPMSASSVASEALSRRRARWPLDDVGDGHAGRRFTTRRANSSPNLAAATRRPSRPTAMARGRRARDRPPTPAATARRRAGRARDEMFDDDLDAMPRRRGRWIRATPEARPRVPRDPADVDASDAASAQTLPSVAARADGCGRRSRRRTRRTPRRARPRSRRSSAPRRDVGGRRGGLRRRFSARASSPSERAPLPRRPRGGRGGRGADRGPGVRVGGARAGVAPDARALCARRGQTRARAARRLARAAPASPI